MSRKHPIIAVTGSSGAGTTTFRRVFDRIFRHEGISSFRVDGNSFRRFDRKAMKHRLEESIAQNKPISHFGPEANHLDRLEGLFREYSRSGTGLVRRYMENDELADAYGLPAGSFSPWEEVPSGTDLLFYEGLHGGCVQNTWSQRDLGPSHNPLIIKRRRAMKTRQDRGVDIAQWVDLLIGVVPVVNLEWIQKIHRDVKLTNAPTEELANNILRRLPDYISYIAPQFSLTDINFQRVPLTDTSDPFVLREIPTLDESMMVIRFREPERFDFPYLLSEISKSFMSRRNTLVIPGAELEQAVKVICTPLAHEIIQRRL